MTANLTRFDKNKGNVILDLDATCICSEKISDLNLEDTDVINKIKKFKSHDMDNYYIVFERPHLQQFLNFLFRNYNVSIWTAASKSYAIFIVQKIILANKKNRKLQNLLFDYHCDWSFKKGRGTKDLKMLKNLFKLNFDINNTIIIDDYDEVADTNQEKCFHIKAFNFSDENSFNDKELLKLKDSLSSMDLVRKYRKKFDTTSINDNKNEKYEEGIEIEVEKPDKILIDNNISNIQNKHSKLPKTVTTYNDINEKFE